MIKIGQKKGIKYSQAPHDEDGWYDATKYMPADFDLCFLKIKDRKTISGWANGLKWDGLNLEEKAQVLFWKKQKEPREVLHAIG